MFPAHAGMNLDWDYVQIEGDRVPRARGDEPVRGDFRAGALECSPRTRG